MKKEKKTKEKRFSRQKILLQKYYKKEQDGTNDQGRKEGEK